MIAFNTAQPAVGFADTRQGGRNENQDTCASSETPLGLLVTVCDGMGGGPSGKLASTIAARSIIAYLNSRAATDNRIDALRQAILTANAAIYQQMENEPATRGMGTTVTALLLNRQSAVVAHVGDSRVYQLRGGKKVFRTDDHSLVFQMVKSGSMNEEQARTSAQSNVILRALGHSRDLIIDIVELPYRKGDRFVLCSDGIWGMFPEKELLDIINSNRGLAEAVTDLVEKVDRAGVAEGNNHDNLTLAMAETLDDSAMPAPAPRSRKNALIALAALIALGALGAGIYFLTKNNTPTPAETSGENNGEKTEVLINTEPENKVKQRDTVVETVEPAEEPRKTPEQEAVESDLSAERFGIKPQLKQETKAADNKKTETKAATQAKQDAKTPAKKTEAKPANQPQDAKAEPAKAEPAKTGTKETEATKSDGKIGVKSVTTTDPAASDPKPNPNP